MIRHRLFHLIAAIAFAALSACSDGGAAESVSDRLPDGFKPTPSTHASGSPTGTASPTASHGGGKATNGLDPDGGHDPKHDEWKYSAEEPPPDGFRNPDVDGGRTGSGKLFLQLKIDPGCIEPGESVVVTMKTKPDVQVAFFTQFKEAPSGKMRVFEGRTDAKGLFTRSVPSQPDQLPHEYVIQAAAGDDKGHDGGHSGQWFHIVAEKGGCTR